MVCCIILDIIANPLSGTVQHCIHNATVPTAITCGSDRNNPMISGASTATATAIITRAIVDSRTQNQYPSLTRRYSPAP